MKVSVLASGSSGNSIFISGEKTRILVDAGLSGKEVNKRLKKVGKNGEELDAIIVTHEHSDHIKGAGILSRRYQLPIYANELTWKSAEKCLGKIKSEHCCIFSREFMIGELEIKAFSISHDAADPVGFIISCGSNRIGIATDMGYVSPEVREILKGLDLLLIESNHDLEMLMNGTYPWPLKKRIRGEKGHLSNDDAADLLPSLINSNFPRILLGHLSKDNNIPELAYITVKNNLEDHELVIGEDLNLDITYRDRPTPLYEVG
ncbi:MAG TPA: MBL fold metallo-hydrolase [Halanaerobiales bacterium]|nr:MBL fold metallo-hydrolase [Halanaerobiales bacterium]